MADTRMVMECLLPFIQIYRSSKFSWALKDDKVLQVNRTQPASHLKHFHHFPHLCWKVLPAVVVKPLETVPSLSASQSQTDGL